MVPHIKDKERGSFCSLPASPHSCWQVHALTGINAYFSEFFCTLKTSLDIHPYELIATGFLDFLSGDRHCCATVCEPL